LVSAGGNPRTPARITVERVDEKEFRGGSSFLQSKFWGRFEQAFGWTPVYLRVENAAGATGSSDLLLLHRRVARSLCMAYVPHGPSEMSFGADPGVLPVITGKMRPWLPPETAFVRYDLAWRAFVPDGTDPDTSQSSPEIFAESSTARGARKAVSDTQPPDTVIVGLEGSEEELLSRMKSKTRYNVRLALRKGVRVSRAGRDQLPAWYAVYEETARRDRIALHSFDYYVKLWDIAAENVGDGVKLDLLMAHYNEELLGGIITATYANTATYLYGASTNRQRNLMAPYALQWEAMKRARAAGCGSYDLFGIPPTDNPNHPMHGLYRFKTGFGGRIEHRPGAWDVPLRPLIYAGYRLAERAREFYFKKWKKFRRGR